MTLKRWHVITHIEHILVGSECDPELTARIVAENLQAGFAHRAPPDLLLSVNVTVYDEEHPETRGTATL